MSPLALSAECDEDEENDGLETVVACSVLWCAVIAEDCP